MQLLIIICATAFVLFPFISIRRERQRSRYIANYVFPPAIQAKLAETYPHLSDRECRQILLALRQYFQACRIAKKKMLSMPSKCVDSAWHEFILITKSYSEFCSEAFGYYLHHTPTEAMDSMSAHYEGLKRTWRTVCQIEDISPQAPSSKPLLFDVDSRFSIPGGYSYVLHRRDQGTNNKSDGGDSGGVNASEIICSDLGGSDACGDSGGGDSGCGSSGCGGCGGS